MERFSKVFRPLPTDGFRAIASYVLEKVRGEDLVFTGTTNPHNWKAAHGDCKFALSRSKEGAFCLAVYPSEASAVFVRATGGSSLAQVLNKLWAEIRHYEATKGAEAALQSLTTAFS